jgi:hypothetical protein
VAVRVRLDQVQLGTMVQHHELILFTLPAVVLEILDFQILPTVFLAARVAAVVAVELQQAVAELQIKETLVVMAQLVQDSLLVAVAVRVLSVVMQQVESAAMVVQVAPIQ